MKQDRDEMAEFRRVRRELGGKSHYVQALFCVHMRNGSTECAFFRAFVRPQKRRGDRLVVKVGATWVHGRYTGDVDRVHHVDQL